MTRRIWDRYPKERTCIKRHLVEYVHEDVRDEVQRLHRGDPMSLRRASEPGRKAREKEEAKKAKKKAA